MTLAQFIVYAQDLFLTYFLAINVSYLTLNYIALWAIVGYMRDHRAEYLPKSLASYQPPVSLLMPAFNEERTIVTSVRSLLRLNYPQFEIVVCNDGSTDGTVAAVIEAFRMVEFPEAYRRRLETRGVRKIYVSTIHPQIRLIDKDNGGKSDALNAGINVARYPLVCTFDADCILQQDSLSRVVRPFLEDPRTIAVGGTVRVLNGCTVRNGTLEKTELPKTALPMFQLVEYLRAFLFGRLGWSPLNALMVISGAFGMFYKERLIAIGGYRTGTVGEDMDLVVRLHLSLRKEKRPYRITFVPDPICWTEAPSDVKSLRAQRKRWQRGLAESIAPNLGYMFSPKSGSVGWIAFPYLLIFELVGPIIEVFGYVASLILWAMGAIPVEMFLLFLFLSIGIGVLLSVNALFLEQISFHIYPKLHQQIRLFLFAILENFGYRQINAWWRFTAMVQWMFTFWRKARWGRIARSGAWQQEHGSAGGAPPAPPTPSSRTKQ